MLAGFDDLEVLVDEDLELLAVARGDVRLVGGVAVGVGLGAHDGGVRVLGLHGGLDLVLRVTGQRLLGRMGAGATESAARRAAGPAGAARATVRLNRSGLE